MLCCLDEADALRKAGSVGRPLEHIELRVVDRSRLSGPPGEWRDVAVSPEGEPGGSGNDVASETGSNIGEIVVRGPVTMLGYWRRAEATRETLREGWVLTGDLARIDAEGFITLVGRSREMFISGGENVYPAEIESAYLKHPAIAEIAVKGTPDQRWGEVGCAFVVMAPDATCDPEALRDWGREVLADFKIPRSFHAVEALPKSASGKIQKHRLG
jgi:fatty-acyl-CoA synthase